MLLEGTAAYAWAFNVGKCYEVEHEMALTVTYAMMSSVKRPVNSKGNSRDWRISERRDIAGFIHENLFRYYAAVSEGVRLMLEADKAHKAHKEAMRTPFDLSNLENSDNDTEEEADSGETQTCS